MWTSVRFQHIWHAKPKLLFQMITELDSVSFPSSEKEPEINAGTRRRKCVNIMLTPGRARQCAAHEHQSAGVPTYIVHSALGFLCLTEQLQWLSVCNLLHRLVIHLDKRWTYSKGQQREKGEILLFQKGWGLGIIPQLSLISWTALHGIASEPQNGEQRPSWESKHKYLRVLKKIVRVI